MNHGWAVADPVKSLAVREVKCREGHIREQVHCLLVHRTIVGGRRLPLLCRHIAIERMRLQLIEILPGVLPALYQRFGIERIHLLKAHPMPCHQEGTHIIRHREESVGLDAQIISCPLCKAVQSAPDILPLKEAKGRSVAVQVELGLRALTLLLKELAEEAPVLLQHLNILIIRCKGADRLVRLGGKDLIKGLVAEVVGVILTICQLSVDALPVDSVLLLSSGIGLLPLSLLLLYGKPLLRSSPGLLFCLSPGILLRCRFERRFVEESLAVETFTYFVVFPLLDPSQLFLFSGIGLLSSGIGLLPFSLFLLYGKLLLSRLSPGIRHKLLSLNGTRFGRFVPLLYQAVGLVADGHIVIQASEGRRGDLRVPCLPHAVLEQGGLSRLGGSGSGYDIVVERGSVRIDGIYDLTSLLRAVDHRVVQNPADLIKRSAGADVCHVLIRPPGHGLKGAVYHLPLRVEARDEIRILHGPALHQCLAASVQLRPHRA